MSHNEINTSDNLKLYDEILAIKKLSEIQETDLSNFDLELSSLPVDTVLILKEFSNLILEIGIQNFDHINLETLFQEALKDRIDYVNVIKKLQLENKKLEQCLDQEMREIKNIEDGKSDLSKSITPLAQTTEDINILEKQIAAMQEKLSQFSQSSLKCIDQVLLKLDQIDLKKNTKENKGK